MEESKSFVNAEVADDHVDVSMLALNKLPRLGDNFQETRHISAFEDNQIVEVAKNVLEDSYDQRKYLECALSSNEEVEGEKYVDGDQSEISNEHNRQPNETETKLAAEIMMQ